VLALERDTSRVRFVTHRGIGDAEVARAAEAVADIARGQVLQSGNPHLAADDE
jgi:hypothetical protein